MPRPEHLRYHVGFAYVSSDLRPPVLVTGATGFVGSHLVERLVEAGVRPRCLVRRSSSLKGLPAGSVDFVYGELATGDGLTGAVAGAATIFHVAGTTKAFDAAAYWAGNFTGTRNLLAACERLSTQPRFIHVSSLAAVGPSPGGAPLGEDSEPAPLTWYGESKLAAERAVKASPLACSAVIVRPPVVYGPRDTDVFQVFRAVARGTMPTIGRGESFFSYIHVQDLACALLAAARSEARDCRTYFAANPEPVSWTAFARLAAELMNRPVRFLSVPPPAANLAAWCAELASWIRGKPGILSRQKVLEARCRYWVCDTARAASELGFRPEHSLRQGVAETLAWYKEAGWLAF